MTTTILSTKKKSTMTNTMTGYYDNTMSDENYIEMYYRWM